ncbi:hypothetical protein GQ473_04910 [archaeon]|nr:hypothetical protein [archaeon]
MIPYTKKQKIIYLWVKWVQVIVPMFSGFYYSKYNNILFLIFGLFTFFISIEDDPKKKTIKVTIERFK